MDVARGATTEALANNLEHSAASNTNRRNE